MRHEGARYGLLTVLEAVPAPRATWCCRCDCGAVLEVRADRLLSGKTRSCGCLREAYRQQDIPTLLRAEGLAGHDADRVMDLIDQSSPDEPITPEYIRQVVAWLRSEGEIQ